MRQIENWKIENAQDLFDAIDQASAVVEDRRGQDLNVVYVDCDRLVLVEETLTDGSHVFNMRFIRN